MNDIKNLTEHLKTKGKTHTWRELAEMYNIYDELTNSRRDNKRKSDYVRRLFESINRNKSVKDLTYKTPIIKEVKTENGIHIVLGCMNVPFHNKVLLSKLLKLIEDHKDKIKGFHIIGDFLEMQSLSPHSPNTVDLSGLTLGKEYKAGNEVLDMIEGVLPANVQKTYLYGNHEHWYHRYIADIRNYKTADAISSPEQALNLDKRGFTIKTDWREDYITIGKYQLLHGVFCTQNPSKAHIDKLKNSCIFAHTHRVGQHYDINLHGVNIGCMIDIKSEAFNYLSRIEKNNWKNGFGIINVNDNYSHTDLIVCEDNGFFYAGKRY